MAEFVYILKFPFFLRSLCIDDRSPTPAIAIAHSRRQRDRRRAPLTGLASSSCRLFLSLFRSRLHSRFQATDGTVSGAAILLGRCFANARFSPKRVGDILLDRATFQSRATGAISIGLFPSKDDSNLGYRLFNGGVLPSLPSPD
ncbi:hypothetical protein JJD41_06250 [Oxynema sp. CENA135]|uniref:hypothetical protein n=1 Tax=Oxynema sp. CENA135 TaxID=984206 RepID=UPI00190D54ED|nr:hypothetical protein [Oxynema sp. CENA135]MBK4729466.1 hypothetical protein [Oxynema sp. CENA135]